MNTGSMPSVSKNLNVGAENKKSIAVNGPNLMDHSHSRSRGGAMNLDSSSPYKAIKPSNRDTYQ